MIYSSEHITLEFLKPSDALKLNKLLVSNTERFIRYLPKTLADNCTLESTQNYIKGKLEQATKKTEFVFTIKDKYALELGGLINLKNLNWELNQGEFAYCIGEKFKGKGWMTEAIKATSSFANLELQLTTLQIITHNTNLGSVNVALQSGFKWKETLKNEFTPLNEAPLDMELYELRHER